MFGVDSAEFLIIIIVAVVVIGPKDLPKALRTVGQMTGKLRRMAAEFQGQFNEAMREAELDEVKKQLQGVNDSVSSVTNTSFNPIQTIRDELKTSIEAPAKPAETAASPDTTQEPAPAGEVAAAPSQETSDATVQAAVEGRAPDPTDPLIDLPPPPTVDPAQEIAESLR